MGGLWHCFTQIKDLLRASLALFVRAQGDALAADVRDQIHRVPVAAALQWHGPGTGQAADFTWHVATELVVKNVRNM